MRSESLEGSKKDGTLEGGNLWTLILTPTQRTPHPRAWGMHRPPLDIMCVGRPQIDAVAPILDKSTFWTSWVLLTCPNAQWLAFAWHFTKIKSPTIVVDQNHRLPPLSTHPQHQAQEFSRVDTSHPVSYTHLTLPTIYSV